MAFDHQRWAAAQSDVTGTPKGVLVALSAFANEEGQCWPSVQRLVERTGRSDKTVRRALAWLEKHGVLRIEKRPGRNSIFILNLTRQAPVPTCNPGHHDRGHDLGTPVTMTGHPGHHDRGTPVTMTAVTTAVPRSPRPDTPVTMTRHPGHHDRRIPMKPKESQEEALGVGAAEVCLEVWRALFGSGRLMATNRKLIDAIVKAATESGIEYTIAAMVELWEEGKVSPRPEWLPDRAAGRKRSGGRRKVKAEYTGPRIQVGPTPQPEQTPEEIQRGNERLAEAVRLLDEVSNA